MLKDADDGVRGQSAESLGKVGADPKLAVPALAAALADKYPGVRGDAAHALSKFKDDAKPALPALTRLLKDPDHAVLVYAPDAVYELTDDPRLVMPVLLDGLKNEDPFVRGDAAHTTEGIQAFRTMRSRQDREDAVAEATLSAWERFLRPSPSRSRSTRPTSLAGPSSRSSVDSTISDSSRPDPRAIAGYRAIDRQFVQCTCPRPHSSRGLSRARAYR